MKTETVGADDPSRTKETPPPTGGIAGHFKNRINAFYYALLVFVVCVAIGIKLWGVVALAMAALIFVPVVLFLMVYGTFS